MIQSAHANVIENKAKSSLWANSEFFHLTNTQAGHCTLPALTVISAINRNPPELGLNGWERTLQSAISPATVIDLHSVAIGTLKNSVIHDFCALLYASCLFHPVNLS